MWTTGGTTTQVRDDAGPVRAARLRRPSWRDPRLLIGALLVAVSVTVGAVVVGRADTTVPVYAARDTLVPGQTLSADALTVSRVRIVGADQRYLPADRPVPPDATVVRTVGTGELVPLAALGDAATLDARPVPVPFDGAVPPDLVRGALVDVWIARAGAGAPGGGAGAAVPEKAVPAVQVFDVTEAAGGLGQVSGPVVRVLLDDTATARVLAALADGSRVDLVVLPGGGATG